MEMLLFNRNSGSNKFWMIAVGGCSFTVTYGKVGTVGAVKTKSFESEIVCKREAEKMIQSKLRKGYVVEESSEDIVKGNSMTEMHFWELLVTAKKKDDDLEEQLEWLVSHLSKRSNKDLVLFDTLFNQKYVKSYTSNLWAAAFIIMGGCSDDSFDYFRAWLLYQGKEVYEMAIENPETILPHLKSVEENEDVPELESLLYIASMAYEEKTGLDDDAFFELFDQLGGIRPDQPDIVLDWDEDNEEGLSQKFPLLWRRYGDNPLV